MTQIGVGTVSLPSRDRLFDQIVETPEEWAPADFEGTLWFGEASVSADAGVAGAGASLRGSYLDSDSGLVLSLEGADADAQVSGLKKPHKPKFSLGGKLLAGRVSRESSGVIDLSRPYSSLANLGGSLRAATHFCFGNSLLTPAGRELLRLVCADQLALLSDPSCHIVVIGEADRPDKHQVNAELSQLRAANVKTALLDILGDEIRDLSDRITALGVGAWPARLRGHADALRNASDRQVSVFVNGTLVVQFREASSA